MQTSTINTCAEIRAEMARQDITQADLGIKINKSQQWVQRRVSGSTKIAVEDVKLIANALDVDPADLIGRRSA